MVGKMKKIVVWLSTLSRVSWLQVWKLMHSWLSLPISTCWWWKETQREVEEEGTQGAVAIQKKNKRSKVVHLKIQIKGPRLCISKFRSNEFYSTESWRIGIERLGGTHHEILRMYLVQNLIRERERQSGGIIQKGESHDRNPCAPVFEEQPPEETSLQADCTSNVAWNLARKYESSKPKIKLRFILLWRRQRHRRSYGCHGFGNFNAPSWARET